MIYLLVSASVLCTFALLLSEQYRVTLVIVQNVRSGSYFDVSTGTTIATEDTFLFTINGRKHLVIKNSVQECLALVRLSNFLVLFGITLRCSCMRSTKLH